MKRITRYNGTKKMFYLERTEYLGSNCPYFSHYDVVTQIAGWEIKFSKQAMAVAFFAEAVTLDNRECAQIERRGLTVTIKSGEGTIKNIKEKKVMTMVKNAYDALIAAHKERLVMQQQLAKLVTTVKEQLNTVNSGQKKYFESGNKELKQNVVKAMTNALQNLWLIYYDILLNENETEPCANTKDVDQTIMQANQISCAVMKLYELCIKAGGRKSATYIGARYGDVDAALNELTGLLTTDQAARTSATPSIPASFLQRPPAPPPTASGEQADTTANNQCHGCW